MHTVRDVADRYGVTAAFVVLALEQVGFPGVSPGAPVPAAALARFEQKFGEKIRAVTQKTLTVPELREQRREEEPSKPHVIRVAYRHVSGRKTPITGHLETVMAPEGQRGPAHAIDPVGTHEGDPWRGDTDPDPKFPYSFYDHPGPYSACGSRLRVVMAETFDPDRDDVCQQCARLVRVGKAYRNPPRDWWGRDPYFCEAYLRLPPGEQGGGVTLLQCQLRYAHRGRHETSDRATWDIGLEDYVPAPGS